MNTLTSFIHQNESVIVDVSASIKLRIKGVSFRDICLLSENHLKCMNEMLNSFKDEHLKTYSEFFDDLIIRCIVTDEVLTREDLKRIRPNGRIKILKTIFELSIFDNKFLKKYKQPISKKTSKKQDVGATDQIITEKALKERFEALGFNSTIEDVILVCEYLISKNVTNAYDLSLKSLYNKYKVHLDIDKAERKKLINSLMAILYVHHGESDEYNKLIESLSEI